MSTKMAKFITGVDKDARNMNADRVTSDSEVDEDVNEGD